MRILAFCLMLIAMVSHAEDTTFTKAKLSEDFNVLERSYRSLHPGLYNFRTKEEIDLAFTKYRDQFIKSENIFEAYRAVLELTAYFQCGHSYPNFYNQRREIQQIVFENGKTVPFHFKILEGKFVVTGSAVTELSAGDVITSIDGKGTQDIISRLMPFVRADGGSDGKRISSLEVPGYKEYHYFDILFPLYFSSGRDSLSLTVIKKYGNAENQVRVRSMTARERGKIILAGDNKPPSAEFKWYDSKTAILTLNDFVDYGGNKFDFFGFFRKSVKDFKDHGGNNLIIDARNLEGGSFNIGLRLISHLTNHILIYRSMQYAWAYVSIDSSLEKYITNKDWAGDNMYRNEKDFVKLSSGRFKEKDVIMVRTIKPDSLQFNAKVYLITGPENSSAGFQFAQLVKENKIATLVGQPTGGNQRGITGGTFFFIELPHTRIEVDVPLKGYNYGDIKDLPNSGIDPDIMVRPTIRGVIENDDEALKAIHKLIAETQR